LPDSTDTCPSFSFYTLLSSGSAAPATRCHCSCEYCQINVINVSACPKIDNFGNVASSSQPAGTPLSGYQDIEAICECHLDPRHATTGIDAANFRLALMDWGHLQRTGATDIDVQYSFFSSFPLALLELLYLYLGFPPPFSESRTDRLEIRRSCADPLSDSK
jgi:hypothetical protein